MKYLYKVAHSSKHILTQTVPSGHKFISYSGVKGFGSVGAMSLEYQVGKTTTPKIGYIMAFGSEQDAMDFVYFRLAFSGVDCILKVVPVGKWFYPEDYGFPFLLSASLDEKMLYKEFWEDIGRSRVFDSKRYKSTHVPFDLEKALRSKFHLFEAPKRTIFCEGVTVISVEHVATDIKP